MWNMECDGCRGNGRKTRKIEDMKKIVNILLPFMAAVAVSCSEKVQQPGTSGQETGGAGISFSLSTRAGEGTSGELVRLYIAERLPEHNHDSEALHCDTYYGSDGESVIGGGAGESAVGSISQGDGGYVYTLGGMLPQWYKFAFVSVPDGIAWSGSVSGVDQSGTIDGSAMFIDGFEDGLCDFNDIAIDYTQVMKAQQADLDLIDGTDLHVYRKIIDRWLRPAAELPDEEDVVLKRVTGQLSLDMGIPEDQFPEEVNSVTVTMYVPTLVYLHDEADGSVLPDESSSHMEYVSFQYSGIPWGQRQHFVINVALLPHEVNALVVVQYGSGSQSASYSLSGEGSPVVIKPGVKTTVRFNGIEDGFREVRYAGFPDADSAEVDVADDEWIEVQ